MKQIFLLLSACFFSTALLAQSKHELEKYNSAKNLLESESYEAALKEFTEIYKTLPETNPLVANSYYWAAFSAYKLQKTADANFILYQVLNKYPDFKYINEAAYLKGVIQLQAGNYVDGLVQLNKSEHKNATQAKAYFLDKIGSNDSLQILSKKFPQDEVLAGLINARQKVASNFNVAVLLPFEFSAKGGFINELYAGMILAADSLKVNGISVNLVPFETGKDSVKVKEFTQNKENENFDLIVGPLYTGQQSTINNFAIQTQTNVVNPLSFNALYSNSSPNYFLLRPSFETQGRVAGKFLFDNSVIKNTLVVYGDEMGDSLMAKAYKKEYEECGGKTLIFRKLGKATSGFFGAILSKIPSDSIGSVFVASNEPSLAANIYSNLGAAFLEKSATYKDTRTEEEKEKDRKKKEEEEKNKPPKRSAADVPIMAPISWLGFESINFEQFMLHNTHFIAPNYADETLTKGVFLNKYVALTGLFPTEYAYSGYDLVLSFCYLFQKYGKKFNQYLKTESEFKTALGSYIQYKTGNDNQFVPIVKLDKYKLVPVNFP
jgi:hypothetical protein